MNYSDFDHILDEGKGRREAVRCAVVMPGDLEIMKALVRAHNEGLIQPILIGDRATIEPMLTQLGLSTSLFRIYHEKHAQSAICLAIDMVFGGDAQCIMKGYIKTSEFLHELLKHKNDFAASEMISMISFRTLPNYHKIIAFTDTGICPHPSLEQKKAIIANAVSIMRGMGIECPKVAAVTSSDYPSQKMPESIDAAALQRMNECGEIKNCVIQGPMTIDMALSRNQAARKGVKSQVAGDADLVLFPDLASASITSRMVTYVTGSAPGTLVVGTRVPVIICSRDSSAETKYLGITMAVASQPQAVRQTAAE